MKKLSTILCFIMSIILFSACSDHDEPTIILDPELAWLNERIQEMEGSTDELSKYFFVMSAIYEGEMVFLFANCCPHCNTVTPVYNEEGELLGFVSYSGGTNSSGHTGIPHTAITNQKLYWKPKKFVCNIS